MDTLSPSFPASSSTMSDQAAAAIAAQEIAAGSRSGPHALLSSSEPKAQPATVRQQSSSTPRAGMIAPDLDASRAGWGSISSSTGFEASALNSWVAFPDSAQAVSPELPSAPQHTHAASTKPSQHPIHTAQKTGQHSVAALLRPVTSEASSVSFFSGPVAAHVPAMPRKQASSHHEHAQDWPQSTASPDKEATRQADQDLLQWDSPEQHSTGQQRPGTASEAACPPISSAASETAPPRSLLSSGRQMNTDSGNVAAHGAQPFPDLSSSVHCSQTRGAPLLQASRPGSDIHTLQTQVGPLHPLHSQTVACPTLANYDWGHTWPVWLQNGSSLD